MLRGIYSSATGMQVHKDMQEMIADNLANANTSGYKAISHSYKSYADDPLTNSTNGKLIGAISHGAEAYSTNFNLAQGPLRDTGNPLDLAIQGDGFFPIQIGDGQVAYTRNGHFTLDQNGFIVNQQGEFLLDQGLAPIFLGVQGIRDLTVLTNGNVIVNGDLVAQLNTYSFPKGAPMIRSAGDKYIPSDSGLTMDNSMNNSEYNAINTTIVQGFIESSNVSPVKTAADMVQVMRGYEANQKALKVQTDTLQMLMEIGSI
jgi:flagellar basal-body rod protein FlgG